MVAYILSFSKLTFYFKMVTEQNFYSLRYVTWWTSTKGEQLFILIYIMNVIVYGCSKTFESLYSDKSNKVKDTYIH